jgi:ATP-dependent DNA helicase RecG
VTPDSPVRFIQGVGAGRAKALEAAGLSTARDLLYFFPHRYEDRRHPVRITDLGKHVDTPVLFRGRVISAHERISPRKRVSIFEVALDDGTGAIKLVWFNQSFLAKQIHRDDRLSVYGIPRTPKLPDEPRPSGSQRRSWIPMPQLAALQVEVAAWEKFDGDDDDEGAIVPIYPKVTNVPPKALRKIIGAALTSLDVLDDSMPEDIRKRLGVADLSPSLLAIHRPAELTDELLSFRSPAHIRIILQEFFTFQLALRVRRAEEEVRKKRRTIVVDDETRAAVKEILPFKLTAAQRRVVKEIVDDLRAGQPMYRLLQGDVGSGKTIVALIAALIVIRSGHQVALLAPTEILVEQHYQRIRQLLGHSIVVAKATGSMTAGDRRTFLAGLREGHIQLVVGTHALLEERVKFKSLGLAIVDEQHRFGVEQRQRLFAKGETPDILVMTATPIPRSLALAMYGDLELSVIDEIPPGRKPIKTVMRTSAQIERVYRFIDDELDAGAQVYIVHPIIEDSEKLNLKPLSQGFEAIRVRFPNRRVAMLHGRLPTAEKEETMQRFKRGEIDILVATTVIEVGIDVPNASLMLIVDADRFGLSQLHQLRGRIGRGERKSYCVPIASSGASLEAMNRLELFVETRNGFDVADRDLELRGPGEFLGTRQAGVARFRFGNILRDHDLMEQARDAAIELVARDGAGRSGEVVKELLGMTLAAAVRD